MSQTIDQLLTDVLPLLPVAKDWNTTPVTLLCGPDKIAKDDIHADDLQRLSDYAMHAANKFPAMLEALREIAEMDHNHIWRADDVAIKAIAAASEVGG